MDLKIGCSGWYYPFWKECFYPTKLPQKDWFSFYTQQFNTVEINNTFYRFPEIRTVQKWYKQSPKDFHYCIKASRAITHVKKFLEAEDIIESTYELGSCLKEKLDAFLFQLPPKFQYRQEHLERIVSNLNPEYRNVIEFRHSSWWNDHVYEVFANHKLIFCSVSGPNLPEEIINSNNMVYLRFHPRSFEDCYSNEELENWAAKILQAKAKRIWIYFNNSIAAHAPLNALKMKKILAEFLLKES